MKKRHLDHLCSLTPAPELDVLGKWMHIPNAKTGHTSTQTGMFNDRMIVKHRGRRNWEKVLDKIILPNLGNVVTYTFVRNPWDRVLSAFMYCQQGRSQSVNHIDKKWTFREYVQMVLKPKGTRVNVHFRTQHETFMYRDERIADVFVGRFENIQEDWAKIARRIGVSETLPWLNSSQHEHYTTYYDDQTRDIIGKMYEKEIQLLGYEFGQ